MYEMQGPRQAGLEIPTDCPGRLIRWGNQRTTLRSSYHRSRTPAGIPVAQSPCFPGTNSLVHQGCP
jgi:hypothetical protein